MTGFVTSADAQAILSSSDYSLAAMQMTEFGTDAAWASENLVIAENRMTIDGKMVSGVIHNPLPTTWTFQPTSLAAKALSALAFAQQKLNTIYPVNIVLTLPSIGYTYTFSNGTVTSLTPIPSGGKMLGEQTYNIVFESMTPLPIG